MFEHIIGNQQAKEYLARTLSKNTVGNSLLFEGPEGIGKSLFAYEFAKSLICADDPEGNHRRKIESGNHPDIRSYHPEGKIGMHTIASMRQLNEEVFRAPFEAKWKIFIIHDADRMLSYSANALLKTFEEPPLDAIIILISGSASNLLPTIRSRCRMIHFHPLHEEEITSFLMSHHGKTHDEASHVAAMAQGSMRKALRVLNEGESTLQKHILNAFSGLEIKTYKQIIDIASSIAEDVEAAKKKVETEVRSLFLDQAGEYLSAVQKQGIEKEIEGAVSMYALQQAQSIFMLILAWYRDMLLLSMNGNPNLLFHRDYFNVYSKAIEEGRMIPLEKVQKAIREAQLAFERSTSLQICLENLFLKFNLI